MSFFTWAAGPEVEEEIDAAGQGGRAEKVALARARLKGGAVRAELEKEREQDPIPVVLSADTVVHIDDEILDKPADSAEATRFLRRLSGSKHGVVTGVCLFTSSGVLECWRRTWVQFAPLEESLIEAYIETGEPFDKAGGYGIQGIGGVLVEGIEGCYFNVMGLPLNGTANLLNQAGIAWELTGPRHSDPHDRSGD